MPSDANRQGISHRLESGQPVIGKILFEYNVENVNLYIVSCNRASSCGSVQVFACATFAVCELLNLDETSSACANNMCTVLSVCLLCLEYL